MLGNSERCQKPRMLSHLTYKKYEIKFLVESQFKKSSTFCMFFKNIYIMKYFILEIHELF